MQRLLTVSVVLCAVFALVYGDFREDALNLHNKYRAQHHAPPLKLKDEINDYAQNWAQEMSSSGFRHSNGKYGENIYMTSDTKLTDSEAAIEATNAWYNENTQYDYQSARFSMATGHFTQLVWKDSKYLGVGVARSSSDVYVCANYDPRGNVEGQFSENVLRP